MASFCIRCTLPSCLFFSEFADNVRDAGQLATAEYREVASARTFPISFSRDATRERVLVSFLDSWTYNYVREYVFISISIHAGMCMSHVVRLLVNRAWKLSPVKTREWKEVAKIHVGIADPRPPVFPRASVSKMCRDIPPTETNRNVWFDRHCVSVLFN